MTQFSKEQVIQWNQLLEGQSIDQVLDWLFSQENFGQIAMTSAFYSGDIVLQHQVMQRNQKTPVIFLNTGYHFDETLQYVRDTMDLLGGTLWEMQPEKPRAEFEKMHGGPIYQTNPDACCDFNKTQPLKKALAKVNVWLTALRRDQSETRKNTEVVELYRDDLIKVNPLVRWTRKDIYYYLEEHHIPDHPLIQKGYPSIGCSPEFCTSPLGGNLRTPEARANERAGRWQGKDKTECGIHTFMEKK